MESAKKYPVQFKTHPFPVVSLFLKWYLRRSTLEKDKSARKMLEEMEQGLVVNPEKWLTRLRTHLSNESLKALGDLLERPIRQRELIYVFERIEEFIQKMVKD